MWELCLTLRFRITHDSFITTLFPNGNLRISMKRPTFLCLRPVRKALPSYSAKPSPADFRSYAPIAPAASDLAGLPGLARLIRVVPAGDPEALRRALAQALDDSTGKTGVAPITEAEREALSWRAYAMRHLEVMLEMQQPQANDQVREGTNDLNHSSPGEAHEPKMARMKTL